MKVTGTQMVVGGILLWLLLRKRNAAPTLPPAPTKPALPKTTYTPAPSPKQPAVSGDWEINCYHQVI